MLSVDAAGSYEKEAIGASDLYNIALNIKDNTSPDSMAKTVNKQHGDLVKERDELKKQLAELKRITATHERDFLDDRQDNGEVVAPLTTALTLQDGALTFFTFSYLAFVLVLIYFSFMSPVGDTKTGWKTVGGVIIISIMLYGIIFNYA